MTSWQVGMRAVCIPPFKLGIWAGIEDGSRGACRHPRRGEVYVVTNIELRSGQPYLVFAEFSGNSYTAKCFRPVVDVHTDISIFTRILDRINSRQAVPAD